MATKLFNNSFFRPFHHSFSFKNRVCVYVVCMNMYVQVYMHTQVRGSLWVSCFNSLPDFLPYGAEFVVTDTHSHASPFACVLEIQTKLMQQVLLPIEPFPQSSHITILKQGLNTVRKNIE